MSTKRKCISCGAMYDFSFGEVTTCKYCGTKQNPGLSQNILELLTSATNYRRNSFFKEAINEYKRALKINSNIAEIHYGLFLAKYRISSDESKDILLNYKIDNTKSVFSDEDYFYAVENGGENSKHWEELGSIIEKQRILISEFKNKLKNNKYLAILMADSDSEEDINLSKNLFNDLKNKINILYPPYTFSEIDSDYASLAIKIALSEIPLLFIINSTNTINQEHINELCEEFLSYWDSPYLYVISDDYDIISNEIDRSNIELDYNSDELSENILDEISLMADLSFADKLSLKSNRTLPKSANFNPKLILKGE